MASTLTNEDNASLGFRRAAGLIGLSEKTGTPAIAKTLGDQRQDLEARPPAYMLFRGASSQGSGDEKSTES